MNKIYVKFMVPYHLRTLQKQNTPAYNVESVIENHHRAEDFSHSLFKAGILY